MDLEKYKNEYNNVSMEELKKIRETSSESVFEFIVRSIHEDREMVKKKGELALRPQPLVHLLSVSVQSKNENENENRPLVIYGRIYAEYCDYGKTVMHEIYERECDDVEILDKNDNLTLNSPDYDSSQPEYVFIPLRSRIKMMLFDGTNNIFAKECFYLDDINIEDSYEQVKSKFIHCELGSLTFKYIVIPFGVICRIEVMFCNRQVPKKHDFVNVNGKIAFRYANTYGNYNSEESILFEKQENDSQRVEFDDGKMLQLSRCWVALPAYSSIVIGMKLSEFETKREIVNDSIELLPQQGWMSSDSFVSDDILIQVIVAWFSPKPMGRFRVTGDYHLGIPATEIEDKDIKRGTPTEEMDSEGEDESSDEESDDSSNLNLPWSLRPHKSKPCPSPAVEIFSVFIGREKSKAIQIYGSIEVLSDDYGICYVFKRDEKDALGLSELMKSLPISDGSRIFEDYTSLEMKFDIRDLEGHLAIKGYVDWAASVLDSSKWHEKQLCSFIPGQHGFAAVHYSIFSEAVGANIKVFLDLKTGCADVYPNVCGSLIAQYSCYDYSSRYNKDYYRSVLFRRTEDDSIQLGIDLTIPLSRSMVVVPSYSSLIVNVNLSFGVSVQKLCDKEIEIEIGEGCKTIEADDYFLRFELDWCQIK